jgi:hypothetical protein
MALANSHCWGVFMTTTRHSLTPLAITLCLLTLSPSAFAVSCNFQNGDTFTEICGYLEAGTVQTGGKINLHVSSTTPNFSVNIRRAGNNNNSLLTTALTGAGNYGATSHTQLNWGSAYGIDIPADWTSGIYEVTLNNQRGNYPEFVAIKAAQPGTHSKILVLDSLPTKIAYSPIGGKSMYGYNSSNGQAAPQVSMERPSGRGQWTEHRELVGWLDREGIAYEAASMMDLHRDPTLLNHYNLVLIVGHNEYWSKEMRDNWDSYLANGGNAAILSGNTMWWQVRFSADNTQMFCYKNAAADPFYGVDNSKLTVNWFNQPLNRPENQSIGVSFRHGGYHNYTENGTQYYVKNGRNDDGTNGGFKVADASHWIFEGTGLANGSVFGRDSGIAGYEVDGALFQMINGKTVATGEDGTPTNFQIVATTPTYAVNSPSGIPGIVSNNYNAQGWGTLGVFEPSDTSGSVFVAPTIGWADGLGEASVARITKNVINRLKTRTSPNTNTISPSNVSNTATAVISAAPQVVLQSSSGGGGSVPLTAILLGLITAFSINKRKLKC